MNRFGPLSQPSPLKGRGLWQFTTPNAALGVAASNDVGNPGITPA
ncbi:protein of unknown function [uncultured Sphingopyxis sp.]|uniref:Uncharacterized protein n=1 Tax=uncultured Sphingopyxis sp. TaxID=310581 RepID=A0A1Y5Q2J9_9SPHN|nr:protein of unknown function [uncultured Sphingopyxis sp.]